MHDPEPRPATRLLVGALVRRLEEEGGHAAVLSRGDPTGGIMLLLLVDRGRAAGLIERRLAPGGYRWDETGPEDAGKRDAYLERRRRDDPDLWIVELDHPDARAIATALLA